jgi:hypothetical protein
MMRATVDFPDPDSPTIASEVPAPTEKLTPSTAIGQALIRTYPNAPGKEIEDISYALLCLALGNAMMSDLSRNSLSDNIVRRSGASLIATINDRAATRAVGAAR